MHDLEDPDYIAAQKKTREETALAFTRYVGAINPEGVSGQGASHLLQMIIFKARSIVKG
jgi:hypothetical protein